MVSIEHVNAETWMLLNTLLMKRQMDILTRIRSGRGRGNDSLHFACEGRHLEVIKYLIEDKHMEINITHTPKTYLHEACKQGHLNVVKYLMEKGMDPNERAKDNRNSSFHHACKSGNLDLVKYLIKDSKMSVICYCGKVPLTYCRRKDIKEYVKQKQEEELEEKWKKPCPASAGEFH